MDLVFAYCKQNSKSFREFNMDKLVCKIFYYWAAAPFKFFRTQRIQYNPYPMEITTLRVHFNYNGKDVCRYFCIGEGFNFWYCKICGEQAIGRHSVMIQYRFNDQWNGFEFGNVNTTEIPICKLYQHKFVEKSKQLNQTTIFEALHSKTSPLPLPPNTSLLGI